MPLLNSTFSPPPLLRNGHVQTCLPILFPRRFDLPIEEEVFRLPDGDFLELDWVRKGADRLAILSHGLEGCSRQGYMLGMAESMLEKGFDVLAWNFRNCGQKSNRLLRSYHSGETEDLSRLILRAADRYKKIVLIGFSLGGNITLKYLGEGPAHPAVAAAAAISVPADLASSAAKLDRRRRNRFYLRRFMKTLVEKIEIKARQYPDDVNIEGLQKIRTFAEFDERYTSRIHGFCDAQDYWTRSSSRQFLPNIAVPTLILSARNDPFLEEESFPYSEAEANPQLFLETPASGGHVGFIDGKTGRKPWSEFRIADWIMTEFSREGAKLAK